MAVDSVGIAFWVSLGAQVAARRSAFTQGLGWHLLCHGCANFGFGLNT